MSYLTATVSGQIGSVEVKSVNGKTLVEFVIYHNQYMGQDKPEKAVPIRTTFWESAADRVLSRLGDNTKGRITVSGEFFLQEWTSSNGSRSGVSYLLKEPRLIEFIPARREQTEAQSEDPTLPLEVEAPPRFLRQEATNRREESPAEASQQEPQFAEN